MVNFRILFSILCCHILASEVASLENRITPPPLRDVYEFWLVVDDRLTMAVWENDNAPPLYLNFTGDQKWYSRNNVPTGGCVDYTEFKGDFSKLIIGDGRHRDVIAVNDSIPAPSLVVYSGSTVVVHVTNLMDEPISIHWHGLDQRGSYFMDGVSGLTQCPIVRRQTFTYRFKVTDPPGTYWFHGHSARDRSEGLFGALIILDPLETQPSNQDLVAVISDWFQEQPEFYYKEIRNDNTMYVDTYEDEEKCFLVNRDLVGDRVSVAKWSGGMINGRGWYNLTQLRQYADRLPLEEFHVESDPSKPIKMRLINTGMIFGLLFSVDEHKLTAVASDGYDISPVKNLDYVLVNPGERYDVILQPESTRVANRSFAVRIRSMEKYGMFLTEEKALLDHFNMAWLIYDKASKTGFTEDNRVCSKNEPCLVLNCPFENYPAKDNRSCVNLHELRSPKKDYQGDKLTDDEILRPSPDRFEQHFLNFGFQDHVHAINGLQYLPPSFPPFLHRGRESQMIDECSYECGRKHKCSCTHHVNLTLGNVVELVLYNRGPSVFDSVGGPLGIDANGGFSHPVHLHGHHFLVLKQVWPTYHPNGLVDQLTQDVKCDNFICDFTDWNGTKANQSQRVDGKLIPWQYVNDDGYKPISKDTIWVPLGGYVVVRFKADNPGWWFSHCHFLLHAADGMAMFFREGTPDQIATPPDNFPTCGVTYGESVQKQRATNERESKLSNGLLRRRRSG